jgi:hypothetical protein
MTRRSFLTVSVSAGLLFLQACFFRRKKVEGPKVLDVLGTVQQVTISSITIQTGGGVMDFSMSPSTVRGTTDFRTGMYVHVYYTRQGEQNLATMVVEKVK